MHETTEDFYQQGPKYLTNVDWENHVHQRIVAACLTKAAYVLEIDRKRGRKGSSQLGPPWWEFFGFELLQRIEHFESPSSPLTIGAVFRLKAITKLSASAPTVVIAVRGTHNLHDWGVNIDTLLGDGPHRHYFRVIERVAEAFAGDYGNKSNLWLCGHSLGATVATHVAKNMAKKGSFFTTFLFNPPYVLSRINDIIPSIKNHAMVKAGELVIDLVGSVAGDVAGLAPKLQRKVEEKKRLVQMQCFGNLNRWDPRVYVNSNDWLCEDYIQYFQRKMKECSPAELPKRVASATLVINLDKPGDRLFHFKEAHTITQWWKEGLHVKAMRYVMP